MPEDVNRVDFSAVVIKPLITSLMTIKWWSHVINEQTIVNKVMFHPFETLTETETNRLTVFAIIGSCRTSAVSFIPRPNDDAFLCLTISATGKPWWSSVLGNNCAYDYWKINAIYCKCFNSQVWSPRETLLELQRDSLSKHLEQERVKLKSLCWTQKEFQRRSVWKFKTFEEMLHVLHI